MTVTLGDLQIAQSRDISVRLELPPDALGPRNADTQYLRASLAYKKTGSAQMYRDEAVSGGIISGDEGPAMDSGRAEELAEVACSRFRLQAVHCLVQAVELGGLRREDPSNDLEGARSRIATCANDIRHWLENEGEQLKQYWTGDADPSGPSPWTRIEALLEDLDGQGVEVRARTELIIVVLTDALSTESNGTRPFLAPSGTTSGACTTSPHSPEPTNFNNAATSRYAFCFQSMNILCAL